jgi:hypothetical protein
MLEYNIEFYYCCRHDCGIAIVISDKKYEFPDCGCEVSMNSGASSCGNIYLEMNGTVIEECDIKKNVEKYADNSGWDFKYTELIGDRQLDEPFYKWLKSKTSK